MKSILVAFATIFFLSEIAHSQDVVQSSLKSATEQYAQKKLLDAQSSLSKAVNEINLQIGKQVLDALPTTAGDMTATEDGDSNGMPGADMPCASVNVSREYLGTNDNSMLINLVSNTSTAANIANAINSYTPEINPEQVQKIIYLKEIKALMTWDIESASGDIQLAVGKSFIIITGDGFKDSDAFTMAAYKLDFSKAISVLEPK